MKKKAWELFTKYQEGLFRFLVVIIMLYWTVLFQEVRSEVPSTWGVENEISRINSSLVALEVELSAIRSAIILAK